MLENARPAYLLWNIEPDLDCDNPARAMEVLAEAESVIAIASFATDSLRQVADLILPLAPLAEAEGSLVNFDGLTQPFAAAGKALGEARPGWKILRRLGHELGLQGFEQVTLAEVQADLQKALQAQGVTPSAPDLGQPVTENGLYRIGEVAMYSVDALCRRSAPLQETAQAGNGVVALNPADAERLGVSDGSAVRVRQGELQANLEASVDVRVPVGGAWLRSATCATHALGNAIGPMAVEPANVEVA
jgi:NADH-quinone oxidoreductase subunit G